MAFKERVKRNAREYTTTNTNRLVPSGRSHLLSLPPELQIEICRHIFARDSLVILAKPRTTVQPYWHSELDDFCDSWHKHRIPSQSFNIMLVCKQLRDCAAVAFFLGNRRFTRLPDLRDMVQPTSTPICLSWITKLTVWINSRSELVNYLDDNSPGLDAFMHLPLLQRLCLMINYRIGNDNTYAALIESFPLLESLERFRINFVLFPRSGSVGYHNFREDDTEVVKHPPRTEERLNLANRELGFVGKYFYSVHRLFGFW